MLSFSHFTMLKQSPNRNQRSRGFKVKHVLQTCVLLAISIWLLNHLRHFYEKNVYQNGMEEASENVEVGHEIIKLGRKDLHPRVGETTLDVGSQGKKVELEEEMEELKPEENEDEGRGGGDDEINGRNRERAEEEITEEVEDLIDVDDRDREEGNEEQENEEKSDQLKGTTPFDDQVETEGEGNLQEEREEHYRGNDASSSEMQNTGILTTQFAVGALRKLQEKEIDNAEDGEFLKKLTVTVKDIDCGKHLPAEDKGVVELNFSNSDARSDSSSFTLTVANEKPEAKFNSRLLMPVENSNFPCEMRTMPEPIHDPNMTAATSSRGTVEESDSSFNLTDSTEEEYLDAFDTDFGVAILSESGVPLQISKLDSVTAWDRNSTLTVIDQDGDTFKHNNLEPVTNEAAESKSF